MDATTKDLLATLDMKAKQAQQKATVNEAYDEGYGEGYSAGWDDCLYSLGLKEYGK